MPGLDGIEVAVGRRATQACGSCSHRFAAVALAAGDAAPAGAKVLSKPIHLREIVSEVERMIAA
jgi:two-component system cell cycle response regulator CpdR